GSSALLSLAGPLGATGAILALANVEPERCVKAFAGDAGIQLELAEQHLRVKEGGPAVIKKILAAERGTSTLARVGAAEGPRLACVTAAAARTGGGAPGSGLQRGLAVPCFAEDPMELVRLGIAAEAAGFDGFFLWDHIVFSNTGEGPPIVDPWLVLAVVAAS